MTPEQLNRLSADLAEFAEWQLCDQPGRLDIIVIQAAKDIVDQAWLDLVRDGAR